MQKNTLIIVLTIIAVISLLFSVWTKLSELRIAFVRSSVLVEKYRGMQEARALMDKKVAEWQANIDTLYVRYRKELMQYQQKSGNMGTAQQVKVKSTIRRKEEEYRRYKTETEKRAAEENEKLTQGALNQINSYIKKYAEENGYDLVLGVTLSGNILYGTDAIDITEEILEGINSSYAK